MRTLMALSLTLFATSVFADVTGNWTGWSDWTFQGQGPRCTSTLQMKESATELKRLGGVIDCGVVAMDMQDALLTKQDGKLFIDGEEVGSIQDDTYTWHERYNEDTMIYTTIIMKGHSMDYLEKWIQMSDNREIYDIKGRLFRP